MQQGFLCIRRHCTPYVQQSPRIAGHLSTGFWGFGRRYLTQEPWVLPNIVLAAATAVLAALGLWRAFQFGLPTVALYLMAFLFFPVTFYVPHPEDYYRRPIDPWFVVLAAFANTSWRSGAEQKLVQGVHT